MKKYNTLTAESVNEWLVDFEPALKAGESWDFTECPWLGGHDETVRARVATSPPGQSFTGAASPRPMAVIPVAMPFPCR